MQQPEEMLRGYERPLKRVIEIGHPSLLKDQKVISSLIHHTYIINAIQSLVLIILARIQHIHHNEVSSDSFVDMRISLILEYLCDFLNFM